jgi:transcription initiation factor IIE alpha subunit
MSNKKNPKRKASAAKKAVRKSVAKKVSKPKAAMGKAASPKASARKGVDLKQVKAKVTAPKAPAEPSKKANRSIMPPDVVKREIETLLANEKVNEYLKRNVSKTAIDVLNMLSSPKTDEHLAEQLGLKINAIRRILNIMQGYGITNYYVSKNTKGWLSFAWYVNTTKLNQFLNVVNSAEQENAVINSGCNDYFLCNECYKSDNLLYTFDAAFESGFKCNCGKNLARMDKTEAETMLNAVR